MATQGGIQELMAAEGRASAIIAEARAARNERMKMAKKEAQALIDTFRKEKEDAYQAALQKTLGSSGSESATLKAQTDADIAKMQADFDANKAKVMSMLVHSVCTVTSVVPEGRKRNMPVAL
eukprot:TRINITY_DN819_c0_g1_i5.p3 TRINITY_DN819_c0_g1~~TRINITY_DN819_c0_g1_i5.p3  ORF type:complete len:122 (+),score=53.17 TRINITY_DN819_c0_g1_i5:137-502(+)